MHKLTGIVLLSFCLSLCAGQYSFRSLAGVNTASPGNNLFGVLGYNRKDVDWGSLQSQRGEWNDDYLTQYGQDVTGCQQDGVQTLPILDYIPLWAIDASARNWTWGNNFYQISPKPNNVFYLETYTIQNGNYILTGNDSVPARFPPANVSDWEAYVSKVVNFLGSAPYNLELFQIWNEAHVCSGFYYGSFSDYFEKFHIPPAKIIRAAGKKVVYGGYPACGSISDFIAWIDQSNAWAYIDYLDVHYYSISGMESLRSTAAARGFPNTGVWQTEVGFTLQENWIADNYPRFLYYAGTHNWTEPNKYKILYFADWAPNASDAYGYDRMLHTGNGIFAHGYNILTLGQDLFFNSSAISVFSGIQSTTPNVTIGAYGGESIEAFSCAETIVFAVHLTNPTSADDFVITAKVDLKTIAKAERVDISGIRLDISKNLSSPSSSLTSVSAPTQDAQDSPAYAWNGANSLRVFYVVFTLNSGMQVLSSPSSNIHMQIV